MGVAALEGHLAVDLDTGLEGLLGVVPGTAGVVLEDGPEHTAHGHTGHVATEGLSGPGGIRTEQHRDEPDDERESNGHGAGKHHFLEGGLRADVNTLAVLRRAGSLEDAGDLLELAAHLLHHLHGRLADGVHGEGGEDHRNHAADEEGGEDVGLEDVDAVDAGELDVGGEQSKGGQRRGGDGEALSDGGRGVAHGVQDVRALAHLLGQFAHLGDATGVVGDRTEGIDGQLHGRGGHHGAGGDGHTVESGELIADVDGGGEEQDRSEGGDHARGEAGDDVGGGTCGGLLNDAQDRLLAKTGVVLGHVGDGAAHDETDDHAVEDIDAAERAGALTKEVHLQRLREHHVDEEEARDGRQDDGAPVALVEGRLHFALLGAVLHTDHEGAEDGEDDAEGGNDQRQEDGGHASVVVGDAATHVVDDIVAEHHGGEHRGHVGAEEVGAHAGHVPHVVAHIVGDGGGIARVILRDAGLHLSDEVGADVCGLGVDAAPHAGKQRDGFSTERETSEGLEDHGHVLHASPDATGEEVQEEDEQDAQAKDRKAGDAEAHDHAAGEGDLQGVSQARAGSLCGADVGFGGDAHADVARERGEHSTDDKGDDDEPVGRRHEHGHHAQQGTGDHHEDGQNAVLRAQEGEGTLVDVLGDRAHLLLTSVLGADPAGLDEHVNEADDGQGGHEVKDRVLHGSDFCRQVRQVRSIGARR